MCMVMVLRTPTRQPARYGSFGDERLDLGAAEPLDDPFGDPAMQCAHRGGIVRGDVGERARVEHEFDSATASDAPRREALTRRVGFECVERVDVFELRGCRLGASGAAARRPGVWPVRRATRSSRARRA